MYIVYGENQINGIKLIDKTYIVTEKKRKKYIVPQNKVLR